MSVLNLMKGCELMRLYILADGEPQLVTDVTAWQEWMTGQNRRARYTHVGDVIVSTVFRGFDDQADETTVPLVYETSLLYEDRDDEIQMRYATRQEAVDGHNSVVTTLMKQVEDGVKEDAVRVYRKHDREVRG